MSDQVEGTDFAQKAGIALLRAYERARQEAIRHGTPIAVVRDGHVVALDPRTMEPFQQGTEGTLGTEGTVTKAED